MIARSQFTPLCPAGHLPLKGGDWQAVGMLPKAPGRMDVLHSQLLLIASDGYPGSISPLEGEMVGRPEGGKAPRIPQSFVQMIRQEAIHAPRS